MRIGENADMGVCGYERMGRGAAPGGESERENEEGVVGRRELVRIGRGGASTVLVLS